MSLMSFLWLAFGRLVRLVALVVVGVCVLLAAQLFAGCGLAYERQLKPFNPNYCRLLCPGTVNVEIKPGFYLGPSQCTELAYPRSSGFIGCNDYADACTCVHGDGLP